MVKKETVILKGSYCLPLNNTGEALLGILYVVVGPQFKRDVKKLDRVCWKPAKIARGLWGVTEGAGRL